MMRVVIVAMLLAGCGGREGLGQSDGAAPGGSTATAPAGAIDLSQAPAQFVATCDHDMGAVAFQNPCLVGQRLDGPEAALGIHQVECSLATPDHPMVWAFLLSLAEVAANPTMPVDVPGAYAMPSPTNGDPAAVGAGGVPAAITSVSGSLTFSRLDPTNRAFVASFQGTMTWENANQITFTCAVDGPLWGAPGSFM